MASIVCGALGAALSLMPRQGGEGREGPASAVMNVSPLQFGLLGAAAVVVGGSFATPTRSRLGPYSVSRTEGNSRAPLSACRRRLC